MKKRRLTIAVLALLAALLLVSPVIAATTFGNVDVEKPPEETETLTTCDHDHGSGTVSAAVLPGPSTGKRPVCKHVEIITYFDTDTNESGFLCPKCGYSEKYEDNRLSRDSADIVTSAAVRSVCNHIYSGWGRISSTHHQRTCTLCGHKQPAEHVRIDETCDTNEYCRDCLTEEDDWDKKFGHHMVWEYDWLMEEYGDYHDYRCDNSIPGFYYCGHVETEDQPCTWSNWYYTAAVNGVHTKHRECVLCGIWTDYEEMPCSIDIGYCAWCEDVNY